MEFNLSVVGQYPQWSENPGTVWRDSGSLSESSAMTKLYSMDGVMIILDEHDNDVIIWDWRACNLFANKPNDISIQICTWLRK